LLSKTLFLAPNQAIYHPLIIIRTLAKDRNPNHKVRGASTVSNRHRRLRRAHDRPVRRQQQELNLYQIYQQQIAECDTALVVHLQTLDDKAEPGSPLPPAKANKKAGGNAPSSFDLRGEVVSGS
jgi:hypothetical protein